MAIKSYALTTRQRVMDFLAISSVTSTEGSVIDRIIDSVTEFVEKYCHRRFKQTTYTEEKYDSDHSGVIILKNYPVNSVSTFTMSYRSSDLNEDDWDEVDSEDYFIDYDAGIVRCAGTLKFIEGYQRYKITYTAGYDFDNSATFLSDTTAGDLEYAVWRLCSICWNNRTADPNVESERLRDYSVTLRKASFEDAEIREILDKYGRVMLGAVATPSHTSGAYENGH